MTSFKTLAAAALSTLALTVGSASADTFLKYGEVEGWKVFVDQTLKSCLIESIDDAGNVVQMGLTPDRGVGYVGIFTLADMDIKAGDKEAVVILIGENIYAGEATLMRGNITEGYSGGYIKSSEAQLATDLAQQYEMIVFPESNFAFTVDLTGTKKAMEMARKCNEDQLG